MEKRYVNSSVKRVRQPMQYLRFILETRFARDENDSSAKRYSNQFEPSNSQNQDRPTASCHSIAPNFVSIFGKFEVRRFELPTSFPVIVDLLGDVERRDLQLMREVPGRLEF